MKTSLLFALSVSGLFISQSVSASILVDGSPSPSDLYAGTYDDVSSGQNFLVNFTLASDSVITGFEILSGAHFSSILGDDVVIRLLDGNSGLPVLTEYAGTIDAITAFDADTDWITSNFGSLDLAAGSYWLGLSYKTDPGDFFVPLTWATYYNGEDPAQNDQLVLEDTALLGVPFIYNLGFRVLGEATAPAVPEPESWALMIGGFGLAGMALRQRRKVTVRAAG